MSKSISAPMAMLRFGRRDPAKVLPEYLAFHPSTPARFPAGARSWRVRLLLARPIDRLARLCRKFADGLRGLGNLVAGQPLGWIDAAPGWRYNHRASAYQWVGLPENDPERVAFYERASRNKPVLFELLSPELQVAVTRHRAELQAGEPSP